jgi:hypothetical protein
VKRAALTILALAIPGGLAVAAIAWLVRRLRRPSPRRVWIPRQRPVALPAGESVFADVFDFAAEEPEDPYAGYRLIRERCVRALRSIQECSRCGGELHHGQAAHYRVYRFEGALFAEYTCEACENAWGEGVRAAG